MFSWKYLVESWWKQWWFGHLMNQQSWYPKRQMVFATPVFFLPLPPVTILLIELHHPGTVESQPWIQMKYLIYVCYVVIQFGVYRLIGSFKDLLLISRCRPPFLPGPSAVSKFKQCVYIVLGRIVAKNSTPTMFLDNHLACWLVPPIPQSPACSQVPYTTSVVHHDDFVTRVS